MSTYKPRYNLRLFEISGIFPRIFAGVWADLCHFAQSATANLWVIFCDRSGFPFRNRVGPKHSLASGPQLLDIASAIGLDILCSQLGIARNCWLFLGPGCQAGLALCLPRGAGAGLGVCGL